MFKIVSFSFQFVHRHTFHPSMTHRMALYSPFVFAAMCQLVTCLSHEYRFDNDVIADDIAEPRDDGDFTDVNGDEIGFMDDSKRAQFSMNGGLRSLADMVYLYGRGNGERSAQHNALLSLGKRNWRLPVYNFGHRLSTNIFRNIGRSPSVTRRRSQQLSVSGPLSALANMLAAEGRRRKHTLSLNNKMKLLELGKRSSNTGIFNEGDINTADGEFDHDYL